MTGTGWPLRGGARVSHLVSWVICVVVLAAAAVTAVLLWRAGGAVVALVPAAILAGVGVLIASQLLRCAVVVTLYPDGTLVLRRATGELRTHVARVRSARPSRLNRSGPNTPIVLATDDGSVLLVHGRRDIADILAAIGRPDLRPQPGAPS